MLSGANPPDPPCSTKSPALNSDKNGHPSEKPSSAPDSDPADGPDEALHPHFSIRDYVFASRSKDIGTNWPFPQQYLQLCVNHGINDLLPPFEPPDLVRSRFSEAEHLILCSEVLEGTQTGVSNAVKNGYSSPTQELVLDSSPQPQNPSSEDKSRAVRAVSSEDRLLHGEAESKVTSQYDCTKRVPSSDGQFPGSVQETRSTVSESLSEVEVAKSPQGAENFGGLSERSIKKCRLIVKFGGAPEPNRSEDIVSNFSLVSDPMASKVCPVCKTFSSTSNTTLNAHIDQCLSAESSAKQNIDLSQHKVKPRKKRSMEDICATAPRCTLEDLDKRNGTNWALDLACITQNNGTLCTTESKQPRISPPKATDDEREGLVYVDSNGTKLLILSKFNDAQASSAVDCSALKKCKREFKNKSFPFGKRKHLPPNYRKYLKDKVQKKKKSSSSNLKGLVQKEGKIHVVSHHEEGRISQASSAPELKVSKPGTLGHWISSKRSSLLKHLNSKSGHTKPTNSLAITHHTSVESDQFASCDYFAIRGHVQKFCKTTDEIFSPPKAKSTDVLSHAVIASHVEGKHSADLPAKNARLIGNNSSTSNGIMLKLLRSTGKCVSSAEGKRMEKHANAVQKFGKFQSLRTLSMDCHPQVHKGEKASRRSSMMDGQQCTKETIKCHEVVQGLVSKRLWKHRFAEKPHKTLVKLPLKLAEGFCGSSSAHSPVSTSNNVTSGMYQSNFSETVVRPETSNTFGHVSPDQHNSMDFDQAEIDYHASSGGEYRTVNNSQLETECCHAEPTEFDSQNQVPANMDSMVKYPLEKYIGTCGSKDMITEGHGATDCDRLDSRLSLEHDRELITSDESTIEANLPKSLGDQGIHDGGLASEAVGQDTWQITQTESNVKDGCCSELQNMEYQADVSSIQGSSVCLSRPEDRVLELGKTSSVTSGRTVTIDTHNLMVDGESSGSPILAYSTISHLSMEVLKSKDAEREPSEESIIIQENLRTDSRNLKILVDDSIRGTEITDPENAFQILEGTTTTQDPEDFWDGQPCCCSRRESIPHNYRILRQNAIDGMMLPEKTKQIISSSYVRPVMSSSGTYSHSTSEVRAIPPDSSADSISVKATCDFAEGFPAFDSFGSASSSSHVQPQSTYSPILRLMGKNLMVMNKEERSVKQQDQTAPCSSEDTSNGKYMSLLGFSSTCNFSNIDSIQYHPHQSLQGPMLTGQHPSNVQAPFPLPREQMGGFLGSLWQSIATVKADPHAHHSRLYKMPNSSAVSKSEKVCTPHERLAHISVTQATFPERDIIVIDDSPEHENEPSRSIQNPASYMAPPLSGSDTRAVRSFSCYPSQSQLQLEGVGTWPRTRISNVIPQSQYQLHQIGKPY